MNLNYLNTILSCTHKWLRFVSIMINKKLIFGSFIFILFGGCSSPTAMLAPAYTLTSSGNPLQAGLSYSSSQLVTIYTGKTPTENLQQIILDKKEKLKNIKKKTLESQEFYVLIKSIFDYYQIRDLVYKFRRC